MHKRLLLIAPLALALAACGNSGSSTTPDAAADTAPATQAAAPVAPPPATSAATPATPAPTASVPAATGSTTDAATAAGAGAEPESSGMNAAARAAMAKAAHNFVDTGKWVAGKNYFVLEPQQPRVTNTDKIEVVEVFNWGCPACNAAHHWVDKLKAQLPAYASMAYLAAGFRADENWLLYQRTFYTAKALGLIPKSYDAMFDANWKSGVTGSYDLSTGRLRPASEWPDIHDVAKFYHDKYGVDPKQFVAVAHSFAVNTQVKRASALVKGYGIRGTPSFVIDGRYRFSFSTAGGTYPDGIELAKWLVAKEAKRIMSEQQGGK